MKPYLILLCLALCSCAKPKPPHDYNADNLAVIHRALPGAVVERVNPPAGPFTLSKDHSFYYRAKLTDGTILYAEAALSTGRIAGIIALGVAGAGSEDVPSPYRVTYYRHGLLGWSKVDR